MTAAAEPTGPTTALQAAHAYAAVGLRVLPIPPGRKHPPMAAWQDAATSDPATIDAWWTGLYTGHGVGIAPDQLPDGRWLFVVDIDQHGVDGAEAWHQLTARHGEAPDTVEATTGGGGTHLLYAAPHEIRNGRLADGIDLRGHGGQIVAEPSIHPSGQPYTWVDGQAPWQHAIADAPAWLLELIDTHQNPATTPRSTAPSSEVGERPGDLWAAATPWDTLLGGDGWTLHHSDRAGEQYWTRPGKQRRDGCSATVGYRGADVLKVFTTSIPGLQADRTYTKLGYLAATRYGGDHSAAAAHLRANGWTTPDVDLDQLIDTTRSGGTLEGVDDWPAPEPLPTSPPPPPWPPDVLPGWIQDQVDNVARQIGCDPAIPAMFGLGALSAASLGHITVRARAGETYPTALYSAIVGPSASGKSPAMRFMFAPLRDFEDRQIAAAATEVAEAKSRRAIAEKAVREAEDSAARTGEPEAALRAAERRAQLETMTSPPEGRLLTSDVTPERLATLLAANDERMAIVSDEAGVLAIDRYGDKSRGSNMDLHLQAHDGNPVVVDRQTAPSVRLRHPLLTICAGCQPQKWRQVLADAEWRDRGMGARFLAVVVTQLADDDDERDVWDDDVDDTYRARFAELVNRWAGSRIHPEVALSAEARQLRSAWAKRLGRRMVDGGDLETDASWAAKLRKTVIRVAALLHLADGNDAGTPIGTDVMDRAIRLGDYWVAHRLHDSAGADHEHVAARRLLGTLAKLSCHEDAVGGLVTKRLIGRSGSKGLRTVDEIAGPVGLLVDYGWVRIEGALPASLKGSILGQLRAMDGLKVHPAALKNEADAEPDTTRTTRQSSPSATADHSPSMVVGHSGVSAIRRNFASSPTENAPTQDTPGNRPDTPDTTGETGTDTPGTWSILAPPTHPAVHPEPYAADPDVTP